MYHGDMVLLPDHQAHRAVDAGTGIPTAVGFKSVIHRDTQCVVPSVNCGRNVHIKSGIAIPMCANEFPVHIDFAVLVNPFKMQVDGFSNHCRIQRKPLFVDIFSSREIAGIHPIAAGRVPHPTQHCVMGEIHKSRRTAFPAKLPILCKFNIHCPFPLNFFM